MGDLMLFDCSKKNFCRYRVFIDDEIGIDKSSQKILINSNMDEDCQSSDEIISDGIKKGLNYLQEAITKKK